MTEEIKKGEKTIFVVEDDAFLVKAYQIKFEKMGVKVWTALDGRKALEFLKNDPPQAVLLDLMLPSLSGFEVLSAIRKDEKWSKTPVIVLSNLGQSEDIQRCRELGVDDYIVKANSKINDIVERVSKYLV